MSRGLFIIITAPSGAGKTTIYKRILQDLPNIKYSVSFTTRKQRQGEINGVDYYFVDRKTFMEKVRRNEFVEWAEVHGEYYGTEKTQLDRVLENGDVCILDVDVKGALNLMKTYNDIVSIFIEPPSIKDLENRLKRRGTETNDSIKTRIENAKKELEAKKFFDYIVINDKLERAVEEIKKIIIKTIEERRNASNL